jgi:cell division protein FtsI/penicillin-binding protein 2
MRPYVVDRIVPEGGTVQITEPQVISTPFSDRTSLTLRQMLTSVVDNGFDKARIKGYDVAGKTGTAQIPDGKGGYVEGEYIHSFVGFAPANNPRFVVLLKIERPRGITFASDSLSPTFRDISAYILNYLNIPPTR